MDYRPFITAALKEATQMARAQFGTVVGEEKGTDPNQVLTQTDLAIGQHLIKKIKAEFPQHNIIDEEAGVIDHHHEVTWVIDPIDGTSNFAAGIPLYGIMMGVLEKNHVIAGGIALPYFQELAVAQRGKGCTLNQKRIHVTDQQQLIKSLVVYGMDGHQEQPELTHQEMALLGNIVLAIRNLRTSNSVFDIVQVAAGHYGASLNRSSKVWDNVAQQIVIEEAGGLYTDFWGQPMDYSQALSQPDLNYTWCAGSAALHRQLQGIIKTAERRS